MSGDTLTLQVVPGHDTLDARIGQESITVIGTGSFGPAGPAGPAGSDGPSAYEAAVADGFVGTEAEWLETLVGAPGVDGQDGADGTNGTDGADGTDGQDGADGADATAIYGDPIDVAHLQELPDHATSHQNGGADELALDGSQVTTGTIADARIASTIARDSEVTAHVTDASDAHDASAISILDTANDFTATDVEGALAELHAATAADSLVYTHTQDAASALWTIAHNLDAFLNVTVVDSLFRQVEADVQFVDSDTITVGFGSPATGLAYLS